MDVADRDRPLTARGMAEAYGVGRHLAQVLPADTIIVTSPWLRTRQTGTIIADLTGWPVSDDPRMGADRSVADVMDVAGELRHIPCVLLGHMPTLAYVLSTMVIRHFRVEHFEPAQAAICRWSVDFHGRLELVRMMSPLSP